MAVKIYIDGQEGTTGLKILERFEGRNDIELLKISEEKRSVLKWRICRLSKKIETEKNMVKFERRAKH